MIRVFYNYTNSIMSLANKYRPIDFDTTIGQEHITSILKSKIKNSQHDNYNYLFYGPRGTGKTTTARILSKAMNCLDLQDGNPCNKCENCVAINEGKTLDYVEIDAASYTSVDNIREEILSKTEYPPTQLKKKIYVIDEVHMLSKSAFNALLKTLEEPKDYMSFILATTDINKVLDTIISRCQVFNFKKIGDEDMVARLKYICEQEKLGYDEPALKLISKISEGCARDAVKYVDQISIFGDITEQNVTKFLGVAGDSMLSDFLDLIKKGDRVKIFEKIDDIESRGIDLIAFTKQIIVYIDQNLMTDMDFLLGVAEVFSEINSSIKYYPYPNMLYKIVINKYLINNVEGIMNNEQGIMNNEQGIMNNEQGIMNNVENSLDSSPTAQNDNAMSSGGGTTKDIISDSLDFSSQAPQNDISTSNNSSDKAQNDKSIPQSDNSVVQNNNEGDGLHDLKSYLVSKVSSPTLGNQIQESVYISGVQGNIVDIIAINSLAKIGIEKHQKEVETILSEKLGREVGINLQFQDKSEFFANQLL